MTHQPHITAELVNTVARAPFDTGRAGVPWEAVAPITQHALRESALAFLADTLPVLIERGWQPPRRTITTHRELDALPVGAEVVDRDGDTWTKVEPPIPGDPHRWKEEGGADYTSTGLAPAYGPFTLKSDATPGQDG